MDENNHFLLIKRENRSAVTDLSNLMVDTFVVPTSAAEHNIYPLPNNIEMFSKSIRNNNLLSNI